MGISRLDYSLTVSDTYGAIDLPAPLSARFLKMSVCVAIVARIAINNTHGLNHPLLLDFSFSAAGESAS